MGQVGPRDNLHAPTVVTVQRTPHDRHKLARKAQSGAFQIAPLIQIKVFL
jgi:hypothetical protein